MKRSFVIALSVLVLGSVVLAQTKASAPRSRLQARNVTPFAGISCGHSPLLPTDGTIVEDFVASGSPSWYLVNLKGGHSYSVEVYDTTDVTVNGTASLTLTATDCSTTLATTEVANYDPDLTNDGDRISWVQPADGQAYVQVNTSDTSGTAYNIRITDTTLINPRWSTFSGFITQYALINNTSQAIPGTLTFFDGTGALVTSIQVSVAAHGEAFEQIGSPINKFGFATFTFTGPSGAITADAYFINSNATVIVPSSLAPRNYQH